MTFQYQFYLWIFLLAFIVIRYAIAAYSSYNFSESRQPSERENTEYNNLRTHNITLASFTIVLIAFFLDPSQSMLKFHLPLLYFSIAITCFFIAASISVFRSKLIFYYMAESIETAGIISLGLGILLFIMTFTSGKVFFDFNQNAKGKTIASVFSARPSASATVSMPVKWKDLDEILPSDFTMLNVSDIVKRIADPWRDILSKGQDLARILENLSSR